MSCCCCFVWTWGRRRRGGEREEGRRRERERGDFEGERRPGKIRIYHFPSTRRRRRLFGCVEGKAAELDIWKVCAVSRLFASGTTFCPPTLSPPSLVSRQSNFPTFSLPPAILGRSFGRMCPLLRRIRKHSGCCWSSSSSSPHSLFHPLKKELTQAATPPSSHQHSASHPLLSWKYATLKGCCSQSRCLSQLAVANVAAAAAVVTAAVGV